MDDPERDDQGVVLPYDDPNIADDAGLVRYIDPDHHLAHDKNRGEIRLSSAALSETGRAPYGGMSVDIETMLQNDGVDVETRLPNDDWGAIRLRCGNLREYNCKVGRDPLPDNPQHGEVWGIDKAKRRKKNKERLVTDCQWIKKAKGVR